MNYAERLGKLERRNGDGKCRACERLSWQPLFLQSDGEPWPGSTVRCPKCGDVPAVRKVYVGVDPDRV